MSASPLLDEWLKLWYIYTIGHALATKMNTFESVLMRCMNLSLLYRVKSEKNKFHILTRIYGI